MKNVICIVQNGYIIVIFMCRGEKQVMRVLFYGMAYEHIAYNGIAIIMVYLKLLTYCNCVYYLLLIVFCVLMSGNTVLLFGGNNK